MISQFLPAIPQGQPLMDATLNLFRYVETKQFEPLAALCDDDFGIVDLDPEGKNVLVRTRSEWEAWFQNLFAQLKQLNAHTYTTITRYNVLPTAEMALVVAEFTQYLVLGQEQHPFDCVVTIVWKKTPENQWQEARWHVSLLERRAPEPKPTA